MKNYYLIIYLYSTNNNSLCQHYFYKNVKIIFTKENIMDLIEIQNDLQVIIQKKISLAKLGEILGISRAAVSKRAQLRSDIGVSELIKIENYYGISLYKSCLKNGDRQNDISIFDKFLQFGNRLTLLQEKHNFLNSEMAKLLEISESDYISLILGKIKPDINIINNIKRNFKISIDWLLYGE